MDEQHLGRVLTGFQDIGVPKRRHKQRIRVHTRSLGLSSWRYHYPSIEPTLDTPDSLG
ncbi:hypothetical protein [Coleofasciculus sp. FACHB-129]|uniref:hypothetical protein n=1 Tax=Coleofasciculus sp. FACHB-129 TaxID=2692785 RepID=UPI001685B97F|nr:hypothetical protein [Coleofasciculus sp. FACHB-129]